MFSHKSLLLLAFFIPMLTQAKDTVRVSHRFSDKVVHSFSVQYNNCFYPKATFDYKNIDEKIWSPVIGYDRALLADYNVIFPSGMGISLEYSQGWQGSKMKNNYDGISSSLHDFLFFSFPCFGFYGLGVKATYMKEVTNRAFLKSELGLRFPFFCKTIIGDGRHSSPYDNDTIMYLSLDNLNSYRYGVPDLSLAVSFLLHPKRNPRGNFIIGLNANLGFVRRFKGYYALQSPFSASESVCDISVGSTYFGINVGYAFVGMPKSFSLKKYWQEIGNQTFDFSHSIHSISFQLNNAIAINGRIAQREGLVTPYSKITYSPEITLKYNCSFANGFGLAAEIPFGKFARFFKIDLSGAIPEDTVWANGAVGQEYLYDNEGWMTDSYSGFSLRASYLKQIHKNMFVQPELGISFKPFIHKSSSYEVLSHGWTSVLYNAENETFDIPFAEIKPSVYQNYYWLPNLSGAVNFLVHGKNPCHNFVFGLNFNVDFAKRMTIDYQTVPTFPDKYKSSGQIVFNMTTIGLHVGYQFMTGKKQGLGNRE